MQAGRCAIQFITPGEVAKRFRGAAPVSPNAGQRMVALTIRTRSLHLVEEILKAGAVAGILAEERRIVVPHEKAAGVALAFVEDAPAGIHLFSGS
jgi:hypothetical protein